ncbi:redox-regulated ATPase YchF [Alphaproteobacteria bacterium]|jgi:GTP-binding protein YchF|nr:redox-regulated ATPase YchF [Alphaproteobacteria bacterium]MDA9806459.1 redox-regulated ATPase YchF [Alphaproteobacteria bacterium]MDB2583435.1 redox-regulated ATPase YchF [Alphaproteobacteria bacterium]MDB2618328.1 redox-regulated ATPase YchF [Alphaproteobacteria bacterium]
MGFKCGIVGLPNVGKSTLFNALTETATAEAANYPFCTIEPNTGIVAVPDKRLKKLSELANSQKVIPAQMQFVDIAGLVSGASKGEGLGNKFLSHIREVDAIIHVLRCFEDTEITHVENTIDPLRDSEIIETELMLADLDSLDKQIQNLSKKAKSNDPDAKKDLALMQNLHVLLSDGKPIRSADFDKDKLKKIKTFNLLTSKPVLYVCNVSEEDAVLGNKFSKIIFDKAIQENCVSVIISGAIESEIALLNDEEKNEFLADLNLKESGLNRLIRKGFDLLGLLTFFTIGPKEARAWTLKKDSTAPEAAGAIHTDFQKGFIRAETISYDDYLNYKSEQAVKDSGRMRVEGSDYIVQDGDIFHFRFNV